MKYFTCVFVLCALFLVSCDQVQKGTDAEDNSNPFFRQAIKYMSEQNYHAAIKEYEKALRVNPMVAKAHKEIGILYSEKLGDAVSSIYHFQRYLEARPDAPDKEQIQTYIDKAKIDFALTLPNSPMQNAEEMAKYSKENIDLKQSLAQAQMKLSKYESMITKLQAGQPVEGLEEVSTASVSTETPTSETERVAPAIPVGDSPEAMETTMNGAPAAITPATVTGPVQRHVIKSGDSLWKIAAYYYPGDVPAGIERIKAANPEATKNERNLKLGQELIIPEN